MATTRLSLNGVSGKPYSFTAKAQSLDGYMIGTPNVEPAMNGTPNVQPAMNGTPDIKPV